MTNRKKCNLKRIRNKGGLHWDFANFGDVRGEHQDEDSSKFVKELLLSLSKTHGCSVTHNNTLMIASVPNWSIILSFPLM